MAGPFGVGEPRGMRRRYREQERDELVEEVAKGRATVAEAADGLGEQHVLMSDALLEETIANLAHENMLLKRRLFGNKTERSQTSEMQLALGDLLAAEAQLQRNWTGR